MALNLGLILGSALAGAAAGGGEAAEKMGASMQDAQQKQDLVKMQSDLDEQKQLRIQEAEHNFQNQFQGQAFAQQDKTQANQQAFQSGETDKTIAGENQRSAANNATSLAVANISAGASKYAVDARTAAEREANAMSKRGQSLFTDANGHVYSVQNNADAPPTLTPLMDPSDPTKPLIGAKNLDQSSILMAQSLMTQSKAAAAAGDDKEAASLAKQAQDLLVPKDQRPALAPSAKAISALKANPGTKAQFDAKFGQGAADAVLGTAPAGQTGSAPNPFNGAAPLPGGGDPGAGTNNPALINGNIPAPAAAPAGNYTARNPRPTPATPAVQPQAASPAPAPYQPSALIANAMTPQTGAPPTQPAFKQQLDAFGRPIPPQQNPLGL